MRLQQFRGCKRARCYSESPETPEKKEESRNFLLVGLGNPGKTYDHTRHNIGFASIDRFVEAHDLSWKKALTYLYCEAEIDNKQFTIIKPQTFMNLSGGPVQSVISKKKVPLQNCLVVYDDVNVPFGSVKVKRSGGGGGHNGIQNIIDKLKSKNFGHLRIGIGKPYPGQPLEDYVLSKFRSEEKKSLDAVLELSNECLLSFITNGYEFTMNKYNSGTTLE